LSGVPRHTHYVLIKLNNILDISLDIGKNATRWDAAACGNTSVTQQPRRRASHGENDGG
jgi:hypothetical protein